MAPGATRGCAALFGTALGLAGAPSARAQSAPADPDPPAAPAAADTPAAPALASNTARRWYGWQTLLTDGVAIGLFAVAQAVRDDNTAFVTTAIGAWGTYFLGGPMVHVAHGRYGVALGDLGLRIGAPLVFALVAVATTYPPACRTGGYCPGFALVAVGYVGAMAIDSAVLAWASANRVAPGTPALGPRERVQIAPLLWPSPGGMNAGIGGVF